MKPHPGPSFKRESWQTHSLEGGPDDLLSRPQPIEARHLERALVKLRKLLTQAEAIQTRACATPGTGNRILGLGACVSFDATEIKCTFEFAANVMRPTVPRVTGAAPSSIDAVRMVVPGSRTITAYLCPAQLPAGSLSQTNSPTDTLTCSGGSLQLGQLFTVNIRTSPSPAVGMGVQLYGRPAGGEFEGPFAIPGP